MNQVIVSTLPQSSLSGQMSLLRLPTDFDWLKNLEANDIVAFLNELLDAIRDSQHTDDWTGVNQVISSWKETALLVQDQVLMERVQQIKKTPNLGWLTRWFVKNLEFDPGAFDDLGGWVRDDRKIVF